MNSSKLCLEMRAQTQFLLSSGARGSPAKGNRALVRSSGTRGVTVCTPKHDHKPPWDVSLRVCERKILIFGQWKVYPTAGIIKQCALNLLNRQQSSHGSFSRLSLYVHTPPEWDWGRLTGTSSLVHDTFEKEASITKISPNVCVFQAFRRLSSPGLKDATKVSYLTQRLNEGFSKTPVWGNGDFFHHKKEMNPSLTHWRFLTYPSVLNEEQSLSH